MRFLKLSYFGLFTLLLMMSCEEETPDPGPGVELGTTLTAEMGTDLSTQVYVNLSEGSLTSVAVNSWELAFENSGNAIRTNSAKKVAFATPAEDVFADVNSDAGLVYKYDSEDGDLSTTAFAGWEANKPYIVDLGVDANGNALGKKKIMITATSSTEVSIQFANLDGSDESTNTISLSSGAFTFFLLDR